MKDSASLKLCACPEHEGPNPLPVSEFHVDRRERDDLSSWCRACDRRRGIRYRDRIRDQVFGHYGRVCACPGCGATENLTIDHVNGDGGTHRTELFGDSRINSSTRFYRWLIDNGFPDGYQVLCSSCNASKRDSPACRLNHSGASDVKRCTCPEHDGPNPLPVTEFSPNRRTRDNLSSWCRACVRRAGARSRARLRDAS